MPLRVLAANPNGGSLAVIDLETGATKVYPRGAHAAPALFAGSVMTPSRQLVVWTYAPAALVFAASLGVIDVDITPDPMRSVSGIAPSLRVVPNHEGDRAWVVQPGIVTASSRYPTLVELVDLSDGRRILRAESDPNSFPIAATATGLVLNTEKLIDTGDGYVTDTGTERVLRLDQHGAIEDIGEGRAVAASRDLVIRVVCPPNTPECDLHRTNDLLVSRPDGTEQRTVVKPFDGIWFSVGGPIIPSDAMPLQTVSPDGSRLLISLSNLDVNGIPTTSSLFILDLNQGNLGSVGEFAGPVPLATWSADGQWVAIFEGTDIRLIEVSDPDRILLLEDVIPADHYPLAAG